MTVQLKPIKSATGAVEYPQSDGKPMAESDLHRDLMVYVINLLRRYFAGQQVYVTGNLLLYYQEGTPRKSVAPDCFVVWGVAPHRRDVYKLWEEGVAPKVVFEVTSKTTRREDQVGKMALYAWLGVQEYYLYDPTADYLKPPLAGYELVDGDYAPMQPQNQALELGELSFAPAAGEPPEYVSRLLGLRLALDEDNMLRFFDLETGQRLLTDEEARAAAEAEARLAEARVAYAVERADAAVERAAQVAAENARLRAELARLRGQDQQL